MRSYRRLTEVEWEIMEGVWTLGVRTTVREVHQHLYPDKRKAYTTVQTIMNILTLKGFLKKEKFRHINFFTPQVSREEMGQRETQLLVSRIYRGTFGAMVSDLVAVGTFSEKELKLLKAQIAVRVRGERVEKSH